MLSETNSVGLPFYKPPALGYNKTMKFHEKKYVFTSVAFYLVN